MKNQKERAKRYLKLAAFFGIIGWSTFFIAGGLVALRQFQLAVVVGAFSLFVGWFVSGYFWVRLGLLEGKSLRQIIIKKLGK